MAASPLYRALARRKMQLLRPKTRAGQQQQQRAPSSSSSSSSKPSSSTPGAAPKEDPIPVPNTVPRLPLWERLGPLTHAARAYARAQRRRPYATQLCTSLAIYFCADLSAQRINGKEYDPERAARSLTIGGIASIPNYEWFIFLSRHFNYASRLLSLATKIVVNQLCFTPVFNSYFFGMQALLAGDTLAEVAERIRRTVPISFVNSIKLWPAVTAFSFTFVPMEYRSVFAGVIAVGWQTYLSYLNRVAEREEEEGRRPAEGRDSNSGSGGGSPPGQATPRVLGESKMVT